jgi:hypothetical protein
VPRTSILFAVVAIAGTLLVAQLLAAPHFVSRITIENPTGYSMLVEVSGGNGDGWLPLGTIDREGTTSFGEVYDVGSTWQFRVSAQTKTAGTFAVARSTLDRTDWHVRVPAAIGDALRAKGVAPQP